jgi:hypothetical protein
MRRNGYLAGLPQQELTSMRKTLVQCLSEEEEGSIGEHYTADTISQVLTEEATRHLDEQASTSLYGQEN